MRDKLPSNDAASAVLTNRALYTLTVSFLDGLPGFALAFARRHAAQITSYWRHDGVLPHLAIVVDDVLMLARFYQLYEEQRKSKNTPPDPRLAFDTTMTFAAEQGNVQALQWLHDHTPVQCSPRTLAFAATMGRFEIVKWLATNRKDACASLTTTPCDAMVLTGDLSLVKFLVTRFPGLLLTTDAMDYAAAHGYADIVHYLHETRTEGCTTDAMDHAARCGRLDIVQFLHNHRPEGCSTNAMDFAAANGHVDVVQFLHKHRTEGCTVNAMDDAARNGHLEVVKFLRQHRSEGCTVFAVDMAAAQGHVDVVQYLITHRRDSSTMLAMVSAAEAGHLNVVQLLHESDLHERHCSSDALYAAARRGRVDVVVFLIATCSKGCLVTARDQAAAAGHTKVVDLLEGVMVPELISACSDHDHEWGTKHRRCQAQSRPSGTAAPW